MLNYTSIPSIYSEVDKNCVYNTLSWKCMSVWLGGPAYCGSLASASLYSAPPCKLDRVESLYGGTKSLYTKSPPLTRANLNRSQSVYTKSSGPIVHREGKYDYDYTL